jgi:hypothetical protein
MITIENCDRLKLWLNYLPRTSFTFRRLREAAISLVPQNDSE